MAFFELFMYVKRMTASQEELTDDIWSEIMIEIAWYIYNTYLNK